MIRFFVFGYGLAMPAGAALWLGAGFGPLVGGLVAWLGGGALSVLIAWGWWRGFWMQDFGAVPVGEAEERLALQPVPEEPAVRALDAAELARWDADLSAELFGVDLRAEEAERAAAEAANPDKKTA